MSGYKGADFSRRVKKLEKQHQRLSKGYVTTVNHDGLVVARVRREGFRIPFRGLLFLAVAFIGFKAVMYSSSGQEAYTERLALLQQGTIAERAGAWILAPDVVTLWLSEQIDKVTK